MLGQRLAAAVLGASAAIGAGVAYLFFRSSNGEEAQTQAGGEALSAAVKQEETPENQKVAPVKHEEVEVEVEEEEEALLVQSEARKGEKEEEHLVVQTEALVVQSEVPVVQSEVLEVQSEVLEVQTEALEVQTEALVVQSEVPVVQSEVPVVQSEVLEVQSEVLEVQSEVLEVQSEVLEVQSKVLEVQSEVPVVQSEVPVVQSEVLKEEQSPDLHPEAETSEPRPVESDSQGTQVLVLGLDGAGKTSLLHCLSTGSLDQDLKPTEGFNAVSINRDGLHIEFLEIGGKEELRPYWQRYLSKALLLVFVVDASDPQRFAVARKHLEELLTSRPRLPLMVLANKQDIPSALGITDVHDALSLSEVGERQLFLIGTYVRKGEAELSSGVQDARDLIVQMACGSR